MRKDKVHMLEQEREQLINQWTRQEGNKAKLLVRIMELEDQIEDIKKGA